MSIETTVERLGHLGDGVAPGPLFVPGALPGEVVTGTPKGDRLRDVKILTPSPQRVRPPCRHFKSCGGCALQHASGSFIAGWKLEIVRSALAGQGLEAEVELLSVSPPQSRRRATLAGRRTKKGAIIGFHRKGSDEIVGIPDCRLLHPDLMATLPALEEITRIGASRKNPLSLALMRSEAGVDVAVRGSRQPDAALAERLAGIARKHDLPRLSWNGEILAQRRLPEVRIGPARLVPPPGAFLQATEDGQAALIEAVEAILAPARNVLDLFSGCGTFALPIAARHEVHAVEARAEMLDALDQAWRRAEGLRRITTEVRDLFLRPLLAAEIDRFDGLILDPPHAGARAQVEQIARSGLPLVAMVSCNPVSFARDARELIRSGFRPGKILVVDQFRWSPHVELVAGFRR